MLDGHEVRPNKLKCWSLEQRKVYCKAMQRDEVAHALKSPEFPEGCLQSIFKGRYIVPCLFNLYAEYIMRNAGLEETQAGIKTAGRNISNLRYADDTTLMAESEEELKSLLR